MNEYTQNSTDFTLEFFSKNQVKKIAKPSVLEKQHNSCQIKNLGDRMQVLDSTLTTKQTEHAGLPFLPLFKIKEEGNGN